jgi:hypothetical protein
MDRLPWQIGRKHCPKCGRPLLRLMYFGWGLPPWRCPGCDSVLGFDSWRRLTAAVISIAAIVYVFFSGWPGWARVVTVIGAIALSLLWFDSIVLKKEE